MIMIDIENHSSTFLDCVFIVNFDNFSVTDEMFDALRGQLKKDYYNGFIKPEKQGRHLRLQILQNTFHSHLHRHAVVGTITKEQVRIKNFRPI